MSTNGSQVTLFEKALAEYCQARFCVAAGNGTVTLQAALIALGVKPGDRVGTTPLTMAATTIAILNIGAVPTYHDVDPDTWLMRHDTGHDRKWRDARIPVSLYGLHVDSWGQLSVDDAAQTFRKHGGNAFTSLSFQSSKLLNLGEGGALLTDDEELAEKARSYLSLGYKMSATQARINPATLKDPSFERHHFYPAINGRLNDLTASEGLRQLDHADRLAHNRRLAAHEYRQAIQGCPWIVPQAIPDGCQHDMWTFAIALHDKALWHPFTDRIVNHGGEMPFGAWKLTYQEPAFRDLVQSIANDWDAVGNPIGICPIAEDLQPRLVQSQTNCLISAEKNAAAWYKAIQEIGG